MKNNTMPLLYPLVIVLLLLSFDSQGQNSKSDQNDPLTVLKIGPTDNNPRNSEGDFIELAKSLDLFDLVISNPPYR